MESFPVEAGACHCCHDTSTASLYWIHGASVVQTCYIGTICSAANQHAILAPRPAGYGRYVPSRFTSRGGARPVWGVRLGKLGAGHPCLVEVDAVAGGKPAGSDG